MRFRLRSANQSSDLLLSDNILKKKIVISSCLFAVYAWWSHFPSARELDMRLMHLIHAQHSSVVDYAMVPFIVLGSAQVAVSIFLLLSFWLHWRQEYQKAYLVLAALLIATGIEFVCKKTFLIVPPGPEWRGSFPSSWSSISIKTQSSFPSGHALRTALLAAFAANWLSVLPKKSIFILIISSVPIATGFGMIYYGFHWPSDVVAGFWVALVVYNLSSCVLTAEKL